MTDSEKLQKSVDSFFAKLEKYYPEHRVFAFSSIDDELRERMNALYVKCGYASGEEFIASRGFVFISGDEVKKIRGSVIYTPGNEPDFIKPKIASVLRRLNEYYPDKKISSGLQKTHKSLSGDISGLYQWLGYADIRTMLSAYGFEMNYNAAGRPSADFQAVVDELLLLYKDKPKPKKINILIEENPDYAGKIKTLANRANSLFGMTLSDYFAKIGLIDASMKTTAADAEALTELLLEKYADMEKPHTLAALAADNPDYADMISSVYQNAQKFYGKSLLKHYTEIGLISKPSAHKEEYKAYICVLVDMPKYVFPLWCIADDSHIKPDDYAKLIDPNDEAELFGRVLKVCPITDGTEPPCPADKLFRFVKKAFKYEAKDFDDNALKYLFVSVRMKKTGSILYYTSPFKDIGVGDVVSVSSWDDGSEGIVQKVWYCSKKTAPYSIYSVQSVNSIIKSRSKELAAEQERFKAIVASGKEEKFIPQAQNKTVVRAYEKVTYFASAVFRGFEPDVLKAAKTAYSGVYNPMDYVVKAADGIYQFKCPSAFVPKIINKYPCLKAVFFAEFWKNGDVYLALSESGCASATSMRRISECDFYAGGRWTLMHDPTEFFDDEERELWELFYYVLPGGETVLTKETPVPSKPYPEETRSVFIKINIPDSQ